jgi:hypothetical protein
MGLVVLRSHCGGMRCAISGFVSAGGVKVTPTGGATSRGCDATATSALQPLAPGSVRWIAASGLGVCRRAESEMGSAGEACEAPPMEAVVHFVEPGGAFPILKVPKRRYTSSLGRRPLVTGKGSQVTREVPCVDTADEACDERDGTEASASAASCNTACGASDGVLRVPITTGRRNKHRKTALLAALPRVVHFTADRLARGQRVVLCCEVRAEYPSGSVPAASEKPSSTMEACGHPLGLSACDPCSQYA